MIPYQLKLKSHQKKPIKSSIQSTDHQTNSRHKISHSSQVSQKLTHGKQKYNEIKTSHSKMCDSHSKKSQNQCTFEPRLSKQHKNNHSRSFQKFIEDQENYQRNKQNRIRTFKTEMFRTEADQNSNRPSIDRISKRICTLSNYDQQDIVDRLYQRKIIEEARDDEDLFSPKILPKSKSLKRTQNVSELLHSDALRRQQHRGFLQNQKNRKIDQTPMINRNTQDLVMKKINGQFCDLVPEEETELPIVMAWSVISQIFNIDLNPNKSDDEAALCLSIMKSLCKENEEIVQRKTLLQFIEIIIKKRQAQTEELTDQVDQIIERFSSLYTNRISKPRSHRSPNPSTFVPETLKSSERYAQRHREKMIKSAKQFIQNGSAPIAIPEDVRIQDIFMLDFAMRRASNQKKKLQSENERMKQCTFKPKISEKPKSSQCRLPPRMNSASKILFQSNINKVSMTSSIMEDTLTQTMFQSLRPSVFGKSHSNAKLIKSSLSKEKPQVKNSQKSILRMAIARQQRQLSNQFKSRGYPSNVQNWTAYTKDRKQKVAKEHKKLKGYKYSKITLR